MNERFLRWRGAVNERPSPRAMVHSSEGTSLVIAAAFRGEVDCRSDLDVVSGNSTSDGTAVIWRHASVSTEAAIRHAGSTVRAW